MVTVPQSRGATAVTDARPRRAANRLESTKLCCVGRNNRRRFKFLGYHAVGVGERNLRQRIRVGNRIPRWPFGNQHRSPKAVIIVTQKRGVGLELLNELREQPFAYPRRGGRAGPRHLGDYPGDDAEKAVRHGASYHMWSKPPVEIRSDSPRCRCMVNPRPGHRVFAVAACQLKAGRDLSVNVDGVKMWKT